MPKVAELTPTAEHDIRALTLGRDADAAQGVPANRLIDRVVACARSRVEDLETVPLARTFDIGRADITAINLRPWFAVALGRLRELTSAPADWDGYGAPAITTDVLLGVLTFLDRVMSESTVLPDFVATGLGHIQLEWRGNGHDLEVEIGPGAMFDATLYANRVPVEEWHGDAEEGVDADLARVIAFGPSIEFPSN